MQIEAHELEQILQRVLATQQPFFADLLTRFGALESREIKRDENLAGLRTGVELLAAQDTMAEIRLIKQRLEALETEKHQRDGAKILAEWAPRLVGWMAILILGIIGYFKLDGKI